MKKITVTDQRNENLHRKGRDFKVIQLINDTRFTIGDMLPVDTINGLCKSLEWTVTIK